jgi:hypothetical protein
MGSPASTDGIYSDGDIWRLVTLHVLGMTYHSESASSRWYGYSTRRMSGLFN